MRQPWSSAVRCLRVTRSINPAEVREALGRAVRGKLLEVRPTRVLRALARDADPTHAPAWHCPPLCSTRHHRCAGATRRLFSDYNKRSWIAKENLTHGVTDSKVNALRQLYSESRVGRWLESQPAGTFDVAVVSSPDLFIANRCAATSALAAGRRKRDGDDGFACDLPL